MTTGFDLETASPEGPNWIHTAQIVGYSLSHTDGDAIYVAEKPHAIAEWLEDGEQEKVAHNLKFEITQCAKEGITIRGGQDSKLAAYLLQHQSTGLKDMSRQLLDVVPITYDEVTGGRSMADIPVEEVVEYAAADADNCRRLWNKLKPELEKWGMWWLYESVELPLIPVLAHAEMRGIQVDVKKAYEVVRFFRRKMLDAISAARMAGLPFNVSISSRVQLAEWMQQQQAPIRELTPVKQLPITNFNTLTKLREDGWRPKLMDAIIRFFEMQKLAGFPAKFIELAQTDGTLHTNLNQCGSWNEGDDEGGESPSTGRLSHSKPNLAQLPHHGRGRGPEYEEYGKMIRECLVAREGYSFVAADVSQQEPRVVAAIVPEPNMLADFKAGIPIYAPMAEILYGRKIDKGVDTQEWHTAKTYFLAKLYGANWRKLVEIDPRFTAAQAITASAAFDKRYIGLKQFYNRVRQEVYEKGYVRDFFGRVRWLPGVYSAQEQVQEAAYREAANDLVQAPAATLIKMFMRKLYDMIDYPYALVDAHIVLQIHDEVILEVRDGDVEEVTGMLGGMMDGMMSVDFPIEYKVGKTLGEVS